MCCMVYLYGPGTLSLHPLGWTLHVRLASWVETDNASTPPTSWYRERQCRGFTPPPYTLRVWATAPGVQTYAWTTAGTPCALSPGRSEFRALPNWRLLARKRYRVHQARQSGCARSAVGLLPPA